MSTIPSHISTTNSHIHYLFANDFLVALHPYIIHAKTILDIGCGSGGFVYAYMNQYPNGIKGQTIISSDINPYIIKETKRLIKDILDNKRNSGQPFNTKLIFQVEDGCQLLGIKDETIDLVVSIYGVFLIPNQKDTLQSIHRVLKSNHGIFANIAWVETSTPGDVADEKKTSSVSSVSDTKSNSSSIVMDPNFGCNYHTAFDSMNACVLKSLKQFPPAMIQYFENYRTANWGNPILIEQTLKQYNFHYTKTHRTIHSVINANIDTFIDNCLQIDCMNLKPFVSKQQIGILKRKFLDLCSNEEDLNKGITGTFNKDDKYQHPFTLWAASNITITHKGKSPSQQQEQKVILSPNIPSHISTTTSRLTWLYSLDFLILLHPHIKKAKMILEIGCSNRTFIRAYVHQYPTGIKGQTIILSDINPDEVDEVSIEVNNIINTKRNHGQPFHTKIIVQITDGNQLYDINDQSIDIVVSLYKIVLMVNEKALLQSIHRILKPNHGIFANIAWALPSIPPSSFTSTCTSDIIIDTSFGRNYHSIFYRMNTTAMEILNKVLLSSSYFADHIDDDPSVLYWSEPTIIEQKLKDCNFVQITNHRLLHSMVLSNSDTLIDDCLDNPNLSRAKLTKEQLDMLKRTIIDISLLDQEDEPFTVWTSCNVTISHVEQ